MIARRTFYSYPARRRLMCFRWDMKNYLIIFLGLASFVGTVHAINWSDRSIATGLYAFGYGQGKYISVDGPAVSVSPFGGKRAAYINYRLRPI